MGLVPSSLIEVRRIRGKGRGVFARRRIRTFQVIERAPVIVVTAKEFRDGLSTTALDHYCFGWGRGKVAVSLGYGSIYNHSYRPNARYAIVGPQTHEFTALREIEPGEEITVNYNGRPRGRAAVWFKVVESTGPKEKNGAVNGRS
jgi:hypothetical protein